MLPVTMIKLQQEDAKSFRFINPRTNQWETVNSLRCGPTGYDVWIRPSADGLVVESKLNGLSRTFGSVDGKVWVELHFVTLSYLKSKLLAFIVPTRIQIAFFSTRA